MDSAKQEIAEKLQASNNILVTVSSNPTVDQLAACIGLTLLLNKLDKHATAVFSGKIPSTIEFLKPQETIETNTDSLRDFIIALDKSKADKLRYKVEDKVVKIFITPYRTSLSADDLNFSQGDFNIDVVLALGVHQQTDLDQAITSHGRILHDATVACINNTPAGDLGTINWQKLDASSLSELIVELAGAFEQPLLDQQIATALLTGIVAETDRFRNEKTTATTMSLSAELMAAGANQQLVAKELDHEVDVHGHGHSQRPATPDRQQVEAPAAPPKPDDGTLEIDHVKEGRQQPPREEHEEQAILPEPEGLPALPAEVSKQDFPKPPEPQEQPAPPVERAEDKPASDKLPDSSRSLITEAPTLGGRLTANSTPENEQGSAVDPLSGSTTSAGLLEHDDVASKGATIQPPKLDTEPDAAIPASIINNQQLPQVVKPELLQPVGAAAPELQKYTPPPMPPRPSQSPSPMLTTPLQPRPDTASQPPAAFQPPAPTLPPVPAQNFSVPPPQPAVQSQLEPPRPALQPEHPQTLTEIEDAVHEAAPTPQVDSVDEIEKARQEVLKAISEQTDGNLPPVQALNAQPVDLGNLHDDQPVASGGGQLSPPNPPQPQTMAPLPPNVPDAAPFANSPADQPLTMPMPPGINLPPPQMTPPTNAPGQSPNSPPPVPPPMMPFSK